MSGWNDFCDGPEVMIDGITIKITYVAFWDTPGDIGLNVSVTPDELAKLGIVTEEWVTLKYYEKHYRRRDIREFDFRDMIELFEPEKCKVTYKKIIQALLNDGAPFTEDPLRRLVHRAKREQLFEASQSRHTEKT